MKTTLGTALLGLTLGLTVPLTAQTVSYSQSTFVPEQWAFTIVSQAGPTTVSQGLVSDGGNPGDAWEHTWRLPQIGGASSHRVANINSTFIYDPGLFGALGSLTFSFDVLGVSSININQLSGSPFFGFFVPTLRQDGQIFFSSGFSASPTNSWTTFSTSLSGSNPWVNPNDQGSALRPDFSASGSIIEFGYIFSLNTSCDGTVCAESSVVSRLDNFAVSAFAVTVPEPASLALLGIGLACLVAASRRRRVMG